jgi:predicted outer membrane repeat protein
MLEFANLSEAFTGLILQEAEIPPARIASIAQDHRSIRGIGGAIYTDGDHYNLVIGGTVIRDNSAREGGGAIFFVVDAGGGTLKIEHSTLDDNPSGVFQNAPVIFDHVDGHNTAPVVVDSTIISAALRSPLPKNDVNG